MEKLVIFGGSFDPIHNGHLRIARAASMLLNADVVFVPSKSPRWKKPNATAKQRLEMVQAAIKTDASPAFSIDMFEMNSDKEVNFSIDTVNYFAEKYPKMKLYFLIGTDEVNSFPNWKGAEEIAKKVTLLYVVRPDVHVNDEVISKYGMVRLPYDKSGTVSSTDIRTLRSIDVPISVRKYIEENKLYYINQIKSLEKPTRLEHSLSVASLAYYIAQKNQCESYQDAYIAGILHDLGKDVSESMCLSIMKENFPEYLSLPKWTYHQFVGAYLAKKEFGITDPLVIDAIMFHATGKAHMTPIGKIVYSADKIDPNRGYDSSSLIRSCLKNYYVGFLDVLGANREYLLGKGYEVDNPLTSACMSLYLGEKKE